MCLMSCTLLKTLCAQVCKAYRDTNGFQMVRIFHVSHPARRCKQCFGGHTATVHTCATNIMPLDDSNFETLQAKHRLLHPTQLKAANHLLARGIQSDCSEAAYALDCVHSCTMASDPSANDDQVIVILWGSLSFWDCASTTKPFAALSAAEVHAASEDVGQTQSGRKARN